MKKLTLFVIMVFLAVLPVAAQEEDEVLGTYIQTATSGTFEETDGMRDLICLTYARRCILLVYLQAK